ncbi:hypothetical protein [Oharaeibacter diazotrophicus]|uniref:Repeat protein (TIGR01451 family) n=1 Tax=Oharaeibacter diazotrophicus TaxID=1920512 RepID=A0A4R6RJS7_9HYPH|nr:hypothetical protein [Oharaeibacter diazotrophicus]TDP86694.1 hypothetical protein EDD54_0574 [Oharaeibacter diazotrophicus]BBE71364.1 hypothetical protein OHA_1_00937 [Pleomorphomonas sp. SM30]GLS78119.1 hypothetical protein GCM10007904_34560 [Oharaeibacter diazotrophicus]
MFARAFAPLAILLGSSLAAAAAPPVNDDFAKALTLPVEIGIIGSLTGATPDPLEYKPTGDMPTPVAVWYRVKAAADGILVFDTSGSDRDTLHLVLIKTPVGGVPTLVTEVGPTPLRTSPGGDSIAMASVAVATGDVVTVGVADDASRVSDTNPVPFQLNTHALPVPVMGNQRFLVLSPNASFVLGARLFDDPKAFKIPMPNVLSVAGVPVDQPKVQTGFPSSTLKPEFGRSGALGANSAVSLELASVGNGPAFGQVGAFVRDAVVNLVSAGELVGRAVQRVYLLSFTTEASSNALRYTLNRRSDAGKLGDLRRIQMAVTNTSTAIVRGCFVMTLPYTYAVGTGVTTGYGWNFRYRAFDPRTNKALAGWNTPVNIGKGAKVRFDIEQRVPALGFHVQPMVPVCTEPMSIGLDFDVLFGSSSLVGFGYPTALADALVQPVNLPTNTIAPAEGKPAPVVYTVRNYGTKRKLTVYPSDRVPGMPTEGFEPAPVSRQICQANAAGACVGSFRSSLTLDFAPGQTRTYRVRWIRNADLPSGRAALYVNVLQGGNPVGVAGIAMAMPN